MKTSTYDHIVPGEAADLIEYRSPHVSAVLTLLLGLLSFLALFRPTFWLVPLSTLVLGVVTLWLLAINPEKIGRKAVLIGMGLALFFGTWAAARLQTRQYWLTGIARTYADTWVELVRQKKKLEAHQLHIYKDMRAPQGETLEEFYRKQPGAQTDLDKFFDDEPLRTLSTLPADARIEFDRTAGYSPEFNYDEIVLHYVARYDHKGRPRELPFSVFMKRSLNSGTGDYHWCVEGVAEQ